MILKSNLKFKTYPDVELFSNSVTEIAQVNSNQKSRTNTKVYIRIMSRDKECNQADQCQQSQYQIYRSLVTKTKQKCG